MFIPTGKKKYFLTQLKYGLSLDPSGLANHWSPRQNLLRVSQLHIFQLLPDQTACLLKTVLSLITSQGEGRHYIVCVVSNPWKKVTSESSHRITLLVPTQAYMAFMQQCTERCKTDRSNKHLSCTRHEGRN